MLHTFDFNAHLASLAGKNAGGAFRVFRVEVREFGVDNFHQLGLGKSGDFLFVRFAGAEFVGFEDLIKKVQGGFVDFDTAIATPDAMTEVRKVARVLGPRGLMPNPKTGTVTDDTAKAVKEVKAGRVDYKVDKNANISAAVGKLSFSNESIAENIAALIDSVVKARPASAKGAYIESVTVSCAMCPGLPVDTASIAKL